MRLRYRMLLSGRVQGVNLRQQVYKYAKEHGLAGWIVNLPDGKVKLELEGEERLLDFAREWIVSEGAGVAQIELKRIEVISIKNEKNFHIIR